ncbi:NucA/NucB deoxyribonuclease domain-containing protein [Paenibacillus sp. CMAA1364]
MKKLKKSVVRLILAMVVLIGVYYFDLIDISDQNSPVEVSIDADYYLEFPMDRYPETGAHIRDAIQTGHSSICTIDREGAEGNRAKSLSGIPTKKGFDRDEWPMAMCKEGGDGAHIEYISPGDNRGAGSWVGNQLENYPNGSRVEFIFP